MNAEPAITVAPAEQERPAGSPAQAKPPRKRRLVLWGVLLALVAAAGLGHASLEDPAAFWNSVVLATARIAVPGLDRRNEEYLVFLKEDTPQAREQIFAASSQARYVADSLFPGVIVMQVQGEPGPTLELLRQSSPVKLVMQYNPSFGCH